MSSPWPTMMLERIGIMGNTQGVKVNNRPRPKKLNNTSQVLPLRSSVSTNR